MMNLARLSGLDRACRRPASSSRRRPLRGHRFIAGIFGSVNGIGRDLLPSAVPSLSAMTVNAASVVVNGGMGGLGLGVNPATGSPVTGAGSGLTGFGLGGPQSVGSQAIGSGLGSFGFGANGTSLGSLGAGFDAKAPVVMSKLMTDFGLTREQAAGIVGNLGHESGGFRQLQEINPLGGGRGGLGWAQWTGPRRVAFENWSAQRGLDTRSDDANYGFMTQGEPGEWGRALAAVRGTSTVAGSSRAFENTYERAGIKAYGSRLNYGNRAYDLSGDRRADLGSDGLNDNAAALETSTASASKSIADLGSAADALPGSVGSAGDSLSSFASALSNFKPGSSGGGSFSLAGLFGGGGAAEGATGLADAAGAATAFFDRGGFTGYGGRYDPAGVVHRGEYVFSAPSVSRIGLDVLDAMHRGVPGYAEGGPVDMPSPVPVMAGPVAMPAASSNATTIHHNEAPMNITSAAGVTPEQWMQARQQDREAARAEMRRNIGVYQREYDRRFG